MSQAASAAALRSGTASPSPFWPSPLKRLVAMLAALLLGALLALPGLTPTPARSEPNFSAPRAAERARQLLGEGPRPTSSNNNVSAVERMREWFRTRGLDAEIQEATVRLQGKDTTIRNVLARRAGSSPGKAVLLVAHHDTVPGSPGVGDNTMGVAIALEIAEFLRDGRWKGRDVILLMTDAEESGLRGADLFVNNHRWMSEVGTVINVDSRGNGGPALLYEVGPESANVLRAITPNMKRVVANSLFAEVAEHAPTASDFMVFRKAGIPGLNFALIQGLDHYHAPSDTWDNADLDGLQDLGDAVTLAVFSLALDPADRVPSTGDAVFVDLGGGRLAWWPERTGTVVSCGCLLAITAMGWLGAKRRVSSSMDVLSAACRAGACMLASVAACWLLLITVEWLGVFGPATVAEGASELDAYRLAYWPASGPIWQAAIMLAAILGASLLALGLLRGLDGWAATCGAWMPVAALTTGLALLLPGSSAPVLPILFFATLTMGVVLFGLEPSSRLGGLLLAAVPSLVAGFLLAPLEVLGWSAAGLSMPLLTAARVAVLAGLVIAIACPRQEPARA
ncbi:MAG: M28 family peptidase [Planctomycetes bacterium]|nr:M28 family peptidase [Planctomycetota bacterium]